MSRNWNEVYAAPPESLAPSAFLEQHIDRLPGGTALDVAAGQGRNSLFLQRHGFQVVAVDVSQNGVDYMRSQGLDARCLDLEKETLPPGPYDLVLVCKYLQRSLFPILPTLLKPGGILLYEQPVGPDGCRVREGELETAFPSLQTLHYEESDGRAKLVARHG